MKTITTAQIRQLLSANKGKIFSVSFMKNTTSKTRKPEPRHMTCREGVAKFVKGTGKAYHKVTHLTVFELNTDREGPANYRSIIIDTIYRIKVAGETYMVKGCE